MLKLARDKSGGTNTVEGRKQYIEYLISDAQELLKQLCESKSKDKCYEVMSDFDELYGCLRAQMLTTGKELGTKARHKKQYEVAKFRAEELGGYFNGVLND